MSIYLVKGKGWRYNFTLKGTRYTEAWFKTKSKAKKAEAERRKKVKNPNSTTEIVKSGELTNANQSRTQTGIEFLELVNLRFDYVKAYNSERHYTDHIYLARKWVKEWDQFLCDELTTEMIQKYLIKRQSQTSIYTAN